MKKAGIRALNEWAKGKPLDLVMIAQQFAVSAEACFVFLKMIKSGDRIEALSSLPKSKEWVRLYRSHRKMQRSVIERLGRSGENGKLLAEFAEVIFLRRKTLIKVLENMRKRFEKMRPHERKSLNLSSVRPASLMTALSA
jgi:hypothetical protein